MKSFFTTAVIYLLICSCGSVASIPYTRTGEVNAVRHENSIIVLSSQATSDTRAKAVNFAERKAFENLLFKGIPNSNQESPMIPDESMAMRKNGSQLESLLTGQGYIRYVMDSYTNNSSNGGGAVSVEQIIKIDLKALRNDLESKGITKKFGI